MKNKVIFQGSTTDFLNALAHIKMLSWGGLYSRREGIQVVLIDAWILLGDGVNFLM